MANRRLCYQMKLHIYCADIPVKQKLSTGEPAQVLINIGYGQKSYSFGP